MSKPNYEAVIVFIDGKIATVITGFPLPHNYLMSFEVDKVLDWYALNYGFDRKEITGCRITGICYTGPELKVLPKKEKPYTMADALTDEAEYGIGFPFNCGG